MHMNVSSQVQRTTTGGSHPLQSQTDQWDSQVSAGPPEVESGIAGLRQLALQGRWRELVTRCRSSPAPAPSDDLAIAAYHALGLAKLRMLGEAAAELAKLGDLDGPRYCTRGEDGVVMSRVPFAVRWLKAELAAAEGGGGGEITLEPMYALLGWCRRQRHQAVAGSRTEAASGAASLWEERQRRVACTLAAKHVRLKQHRAALSLLNQQLQEDSQPAVVWEQVCRVQLSLGDVAAAGRSAEQAQRAWRQQHPQQTVQGGEGDGWQGESTAGLLAFAQQDFKGAAERYAALLQRDPGNAAAASNRALCLLYGGSLEGGLLAMEDAFRNIPGSMIQETAVLNLASMYDLSASAASVEGKRRMAAWVAAAAPDDLDLACTKTALG